MGFFYSWLDPLADFSMLPSPTFKKVEQMRVCMVEASALGESMRDALRCVETL